MGARSHRAGRCAETHAREQQVDLRTECLEPRLEQQVLLKAVAAAALGHELALEIVRGKRHRDAALRIEILEGDRGGVRAVHLRKARAPAQADPLQVGIEVEHGADCSVPLR